MLRTAIKSVQDAVDGEEARKVPDNAREKVGSVKQ